MLTTVLFWFPTWSYNFVIAAPVWVLNHKWCCKQTCDSQMKWSQDDRQCLVSKFYFMLLLLFTILTQFLVCYWVQNCSNSYEHTKINALEFQKSHLISYSVACTLIGLYYNFLVAFFSAYGLPPHVPAEWTGQQPEPTVSLGSGSSLWGGPAGCGHRMDQWG